MISKEEATRMLGQSREVSKYLNSLSTRNRDGGPSMTVLYAQTQVELFLQRLVSNFVAEFQDAN